MARAVGSIYIHCFCHRLNLGIMDAATENQSTNHVFATIDSMSLWFKASAKRHGHLRAFLEGGENRVKALSSMSEEDFVALERDYKGKTTVKMLSRKVHLSGQNLILL